MSSCSATLSFSYAFTTTATFPSPPGPSPSSVDASRVLVVPTVATDAASDPPPSKHEPLLIPIWVLDLILTWSTTLPTPSRSSRFLHVRLLKLRRVTLSPTIILIPTPISLQQTRDRLAYLFDNLVEVFCRGRTSSASPSTGSVLVPAVESDARLLERRPACARPRPAEAQVRRCRW